MKFAKVIVDISLDKIDRPFDYIIPESLESKIQAGTPVIIPFGKGDREIKGFVIDVVGDTDFDKSKLKSIKSVADSDVEAEQELIGLAWWIKEHYASTMNQALKTVLPVKQKVKQNQNQTVVLNIDNVDEKIEQYTKKNAKARVRLLKELKTSKQISKDIVKNKLNISPSTLKTMEELGDITIESEVAYRTPYDESLGEYNIKLNDEQEKVSEAIKDTMTFEKDGRVNVHLIHGITGSGKTEVYMDLIDHCLAKGKQAIVLIPEIALTFQTMKRFSQKFKDNVSFIHSKLSKGERFDQFERARNKDISVMIGPRSALFTPFPDLGLIVIDEEHETSYKSESVPKYHAIEVAQKRALDNGATVVLGSATPSMESYYRAKEGYYKLHKLTKREKGDVPDVEIIDMREEHEKGNKSIISERLRDLITDRLSRKEQTMLFLNRRGISRVVSCKNCGEAIKCDHCDVTLTLHRGSTMKCHYCGREKVLPKTCPKCGSKYLSRMGTGTQAIEDEIKEMFPQAKVLRMDRDTTSTKDGHAEILSAFESGDADILVGTQMIVKGHDFPNVTLVGVLAADMSLYVPDYTATERTFQLICQAAGRAGRGEGKGEVVVQTYSPDNYGIETACKQDYESFFENELPYRKLSQYPPVVNMVSILIQDKNKRKLDVATEQIANLIKQVKEKKYNELFIIGPSIPQISFINDVHRSIIYIKGTSITNLINLKNYLEDVINKSDKLKYVNVQFDFKS